MHSLSPCIGMGVPLIAVSTQNRISNFMKTIDLEDQCEYAFNKYFVTNLTNKIDYVLKTQKIQDKQKKVKVCQLQILKKLFIKNDIQNFEAGQKYD